MSMQRIGYTMERIRVATPASPIAVFTSDNDGVVESSFVNTVQTRARIDRHDPRLIGIYHKMLDLPAVEFEIRQAMDLVKRRKSGAVKT